MSEEVQQQPAAANPAEDVSEGLSEDQAAARIYALLSGKKPEDTGDAEADAKGDEKPEATSDQPEVEAGEDTGEESADDKDAEEPDAPRTFKVKVDGQEVEVTEEELIRGYSFTAHNTRKSQQLAKERKDFEAERETVRADRTRYAEMLPKLEEIIRTSLNPYEGVDWARLQAENPAEFAQHRAAYDLQRERMAKVAEEKRVVAEQQAKEEAERFQSYIAEQTALLQEKMPEWRDTAKMQEGLAELAKWASESAGLSNEDMALILDHKHYLIMHKAMLYDRLNAKAKVAKEKVAEGKKTAETAARSGKKPAPTETDRVRERLKRSGSVDDAAALFRMQLKQERPATR